MIYLDNGATSFPKPEVVKRAVLHTMEHCANPSRGGHEAALAADKVVFRCREVLSQMFACKPEQVVFTPGCTYGLNMAIRTLIEPGDRVIISGFEHNAVTRVLHALGAEIVIAGRKLFSVEDTLQKWEDALRQGAKAAVVTHVSNVFGYILPLEKIAELCRHYGVPLVVDAAQSAGSLPVSLEKLGAAFIAMPGHKGLLGPQGVGVLLCGSQLQPLVCGGTGNVSRLQQMPADLPERGEAGTLNVPGIGGLLAGAELVQKIGINTIFQKEQTLVRLCAKQLSDLGMRVFAGQRQSGVISFVGKEDCEEIAMYLSGRGIAVRAGFHCAPLAHESAGTLESGTVRVSFGPFSTADEVYRLANELRRRK